MVSDAFKATYYHQYSSPGCFTGPSRAVHAVAAGSCSGRRLQVTPAQSVDGGPPLATVWWLTEVLSDFHMLNLFSQSIDRVLTCMLVLRSLSGGNFCACRPAIKAADRDQTILIPRKHSHRSSSILGSRSSTAAPPSPADLQTAIAFLQTAEQQCLVLQSKQDHSWYQAWIYLSAWILPPC